MNPASRALWNSEFCFLPCILLLCVCWYSWCDVAPAMLLELMELLFGLGVAIVVFRQAAVGGAMQSETSAPLSLPLQTGHCVTWTQQLHRGHVYAGVTFRVCWKSAPFTPFLLSTRFYQPVFICLSFYLVSNFYYNTVQFTVILKSYCRLIFNIW